MAAEIRIGDIILPAVECDSCPTLTRLFPPESLPAHFEHYHSDQVVKVAHGRQGGRPKGNRNISSMSSTGVERKQGIRFAR
jgi:hypothetical protein